MAVFSQNYSISTKETVTLNLISCEKAHFCLTNCEGTTLELTVNNIKKQIIVDSKNYTLRLPTNDLPMGIYHIRSLDKKVNLIVKTRQKDDETVLFCSAGQNYLISKDGILSIENLEKNNFVKLKDSAYLIFQEENSYTLRFRLRVHLKCPIGKVQLTLFKNDEILYTSDYLKNGHKIEYHYENVQQKDDKFFFSLSNRTNIEDLDFRGSITASAARFQLRNLTLFDKNAKISYIPDRPNLPNPPFPEQYPEGAVFPWSSNILPWKVNQDVEGTPNSNGYDKFQSVPVSLGFYMGIDMLTIDSKDPRLTVFLTNLADRGTANYRKKVYMKAMLTSFLADYNTKMDSFLNESFANFTTYDKPVLSSFREAIIRFFLNLHIGQDNYPDFVIKYFTLFVDVVGFGDPDRPGRNEAYLYGNSVVEKVKKYFTERNNIIIANKDTSTFLYHWHLAGLAPEGLLIESIHNIIAFSQFNHLLFLLIEDKIKGTVTPLGRKTYDFFAKISEENLSDSQKLNVIREAYRLLVPNNISFSKVQSEDQLDIYNQSRHIHQLMMINNVGMDYFNYSPELYADFETTLKDTTVINSSNPENSFTVSPIDNETLLDKTNEKVIPVFDKPVYTPFGLGYRRCPGEIFSYLLTQKMMERFASLDFFEKEDITGPLVTLAPFKAVVDNIFVRTVV